MFAELLERARGTRRALPLDMDIETIESMNGEQLATVTDRLLLRARVTSRRLSTNKQAFANDRRSSGRPVSSIRALQARGSVASIPSLASSRARIPEAERTLFVRARKFSTSTASAAVLATLFAIAIAVTSVV